MTADEGFRPWAIRRYAFARLEWAAAGGSCTCSVVAWGVALMECGRKMTVLILSDETVACDIMTCVSDDEMCVSVCARRRICSRFQEKSLLDRALNPLYLSAAQAKFVTLFGACT